QHQSDHDVLTDLLNRRAMQRLLAGEARRQKRLRGSYGVLSVDVDHFKAINDAHGHPVGDLMLQRVAQALRSAASRELDQVARMGGEEFVILLPGQDARGAERVARRVMEAIAHVEGPAAAPQMRITVSVGLAVVTGSDQEVEHTTALMKRLDDALLAAKANGRNCIVHASAAGSARAAGVPTRTMPPEAMPRATPGAPEPLAAAPAHVEAPAVLEFD
ncbi:MAG: GGDEF domain-containing protein, partial [Rubrivivax sp.]